MLYNGWLLELARRLQNKLELISVQYNFDLGDEFEIALGEFLREVLPDRAGICRGFIVTRDGEAAGDDLIIYDRARFSTLRALGGRFERKERIPAEAVLAYIEAKYTLHLEGTGGQSLTKACDQVERVKRLTRAPVPCDGTEPKRRGYPDIRNPWYVAIFARRVVSKQSDVDASELASQLAQVVTNLREVPDAVLAGSLVALPAMVAPERPAMIRPFKNRQTETVFARVEDASLGVAVLHLLWAIDFIRLGEMPLEEMIVEGLGGGHAKLVAAPIQPGKKS